MKTQQHNTLRCRWAQPHGENWLWWATYVHATQLKPRQTNSYCVTSDFKKLAKCSTVVHCFPYTTVYGMWMCLSTASTLTSSGEPSTKDRRHADKLSFPRSQPQLPTPFLRPAHPPKQRSNPGWFAPWSANKAVTWTLQDTWTKSQNTRSLTLTAHRQMHARTHPTLLARDSHYGNERRTRRKWPLWLNEKKGRNRHVSTHVPKSKWRRGWLGQPSQLAAAKTAAGRRSPDEKAKILVDVPRRVSLFQTCCLSWSWLLAPWLYQVLGISWSVVFSSSELELPGSAFFARISELERRGSEDGERRLDSPWRERRRAVGKVLPAE